MIFIRHGHGEHLIDYPNQLNTLHPGLTPYGKMQINQLAEESAFTTNDLFLVSPTKRTIETAQILRKDNNFIITPFVGPRMFPQNPNLPFLICDQIYCKEDIIKYYLGIEILDFELDCWGEGINRIDPNTFEDYAHRLLAWIKEKGNRIFIISHDGTITNYRILLGEQELTRKDFLGEAGVFRRTL
nr:histidine phosphatase family protein [Paenibacillus dendrobii]